MKLPGRTNIPTDELRRVALAALVSALDGDERETKDKSGRRGIRKMVAGAAIYAAGVAAFKNRDLIREQLLARAHADGDEDLDDEDEFVEEDSEDFGRDEDDEPEDAGSAPARRKRPSRSRS